MNGLFSGFWGGVITTIIGIILIVALGGSSLLSGLLGTTTG